MVKTWDLKEDSQENEHIKDLNGQSVRTWLWIQAEWYPGLPGGSSKIEAGNGQSPTRKS